MFIRNSLVAGAATVAMVCAGASYAGGAFTEGPFNNVHDETTNWGPFNLPLPQFDEMGGMRTLISVTIDWIAGVDGAASAESLDNAPSVITATLAADITLDGPSGFSENPMPSDSEMFNATAYDGTTDFGGTSGVVFPDLAGSEGGMAVFSAPADMAPFIGVGDVIFVASATANSTASGPGNVVQQFNTNANVSVSITYSYDEDTTTFCDPACDEPNDVCDPLDIEGSCTIHDYVECGKYINETLEIRTELGCEPDTYIVLFDKDNNFINKDDNGSNKGNGWASGLYGVGQYDENNPLPYGDGGDGIIDNGDGTYTLRIGVTGRADGLDTTFNGLFMNAPHGQLGDFRMYVAFLDGAGDLLVGATLPDGSAIENPAIYDDEFITGAEAFHINYVLPVGAVSANVWIDNVIESEELRNDVDFFCIENLVPLCDYCITQVGGLDVDCVPTAIAIGWFDKNCTLILMEEGNLEIPGYTELCFVADVNGRAIIAVTGAGDANFNGLDDMLEVPEGAAPRAPGECPEPTPGHGVAGCYTLCIEVVGDHGGTIPGGGGNEGALMQEALDNGDLNMDGVTNTADLGILLGNFGWVSGL